MHRVLFVPILVIAGMLTVACDAFSSTGGLGPSTAAEPTATTSVQAPAGPCNSRLGGKVTNVSTNQSPANAAVEIKSGARSMKTVTDNNGLYGFAGLCAGEYSMTITPPGGSAIPNPNKVTLNGTDPVKVDLPYQ